MHLLSISVQDRYFVYSSQVNHELNMSVWNRLFSAAMKLQGPEDYICVCDVIQWSKSYLRVLFYGPYDRQLTTNGYLAKHCDNKYSMHAQFFVFILFNTNVYL